MRKAEIQRKTNEVVISGELNIDGEGFHKISTTFEPLNHLLTAFAFHGFFDLNLQAAGDLQHHIIEDIGIALGKAFKQALADKQGINRYGCFTVVMDKVAVEAAVDISGRPNLYGWTVDKRNKGLADILDTVTFDDTSFTARHIEEFLEAFVQHSGVSVVYIIKSSEGDLHHIAEALFKALAKALGQASQIDPRRKGIPSTKGIID